MSDLPLARILVADDEPDVRVYVQRCLERRGAGVIREAADGLEAMRLVEEWRPDLLVLDLQMPGLSGWEVMEQSRAAVPDLKIIVVTGQVSETPDQEEVLRRHAVMILRKPQSLDVLAGTILNALADRKGPEQAEPVTEASGRPSSGARALAHRLANIHARIRVSCEGYIDGLGPVAASGGGQDPAVRDAVEVMKRVMAAVDEADREAAQIRAL